MSNVIIFGYLAFAVALLPNGAMGLQYCFRNREANGRMGSCTDLIQDITTKAECCTAGGDGWTTKSSGRRCEDTCEGQSQESSEEQVVVIEEHYCFRTRIARGILGSCEDLIGIKTKEVCCRLGGKGWTEKVSGKRCQETCDAVVDHGPVGHCFSNRRNNRGRRCFNPSGEMTRSECCRQAGIGWTENADGVACEDPCAQDLVDGGWSDWGHWTACSVTCLEGLQERSRSCDNPSPTPGGADCAGSRTEEAFCQEGPCPIDGRWGSWGVAGSCSATCESGSSPVYKQRHRLCDNPAPAHGGNNCDGPATRNIRCTPLPVCPIDGGWSEYDEWSACSQTCETGTKVHERRCDNPRPQHGGQNCSGEARQEADCVIQPHCPIDGNWGSWGITGSCSATCRSESASVYKQQRRPCDNPAPAHGGKHCEGPGTRRIRCTSLPLCSIDGAWSNYDEWSVCSQTCEAGTKTRERRCDNPIPQHGGQDCSGRSRQETDCELQPHCPVHGGWELWSMWNECDAPRCGIDGQRFRSRTCTNPRPTHGGISCIGNLSDREDCSVCPRWSEWSVWLACTDDCREGSVRNRYRKCLGSGRCDGNEYMQTKSCSELDPCPEEGGSGSGSGSGSGADYTDIICDDEDECIPTVDSYSDLGDPDMSYSVQYVDHDVPISDGPIEDVPIGEADSVVKCKDSTSDYSVDYNEDDDCKDPDGISDQDVDLPDPANSVSYSLEDQDTVHNDDNQDPSAEVDPPIDYGSYSLEDDVGIDEVEPVKATDPPIDYLSYSLEDDVEVDKVDPVIAIDPLVDDESYSVEDDVEIDEADPKKATNAPIDNESYSLDDNVEIVEADPVEESLSYSMALK